MSFNQLISAINKAIEENRHEPEKIHELADVLERAAHRVRCLSNSIIIFNKRKRGKKLCKKS